MRKLLPKLKVLKTFEKNIENNLTMNILKNINRLYFNNLNLFNEIDHFITTREQFDLMEVKTSNHIQILEESLSVLGYKAVYLQQVHGNEIIKSENFNYKLVNPIANGDALISNQKKTCLLIKTADCVPVLIYDNQKQIIAAIHAGWKGTYQEICKKTISEFTRNYDSNINDLYVGIGPAISPEIYEVGKEVYEKFISLNPIYAKFFKHVSREKWLFNLWEANKFQILNTGIPEKNIEIMNICTYKNTDKLYSARKEGIETGRIITGIMLK